MLIARMSGMALTATELAPEAGVMPSSRVPRAAHAGSSRAYRNSTHPFRNGRHSVKRRSSWRDMR
jgi:hypothetical protein